MMWDNWHGWGFHMMSWWGVFVMLFLIIAVFLVISRSSEPTPTSANDTPLDILKRRYARGEIDDEEFERRKHELEI